MIKVILFDVDGVLVNGSKFAETLQNDYGITRNQTRDFFRGKFLDCLIGKADLKKEIEPFLKEWKIQLTADEFVQYWFKSEHSVNDSLVEMVKKLKASGIHCHLATNQEQYRVDYILKEMGFAELFEKVFSSSYVGVQKPEAAYFEKIMSELNATRDEVMLWDDIDRFVETARQFGINAELYTDTTNFRQIMREKYMINLS